MPISFSSYYSQLSSISLKLILVLSLLVPGISRAQDFDISTLQAVADLSENIQYVYDAEQVHLMSELVLMGNDLEQNGNVEWSKLNQRKQHQFMLPGLYWFRVNLSNPYDTAKDVTLQLEYPSINIADLYMISSNGSVDTLYTDTGLNDKFDNRPSPNRNLVNTVSLPANTTVTMLWRVESEPLVQLRFRIWTPSEFDQADQNSQLLHGMIYGILIVMALYNLFLFFSTQEKSYFYYVFYVLTAAYLLAADEGHIYQYIATDENWAKIPVYAGIYIVNLFSFARFCNTFLRLSKRSPALMWTVRGFTILSTTSVALVAVTSNHYLMYIAAIGISGVYGGALIAGFVVRKAGVISAGHFVIAIMVQVFAMLTSNMATLGLIASNNIVENLSPVGTTLMLVFFSLALADRINQLQKENDAANIGIAKANEEKYKSRQELNKSQEERLKLEQAASQARLESRSKSNFLSTMSHEIRSPMNSMLAMTDMMKSTSLDEKQTRYINDIELSGRELLGIINDLQVFTTIEAGKLELDIASFNLETLLDDCISTFALKAMEKDINFIADLDTSIDPVLRGDATKLRQIILNLLSNAFKFTDQGDIIIKVRSTEKPAINSLELKFEVMDSGIGLTALEKDRLFTPFQHAEEGAYGQYGGSGLGLSISKQLAELMDGKIGVDSEAGKGSCFWFTARFLAEENPDLNLLRKKSSLLSHKHLLLVDPNHTSADIVKRLLKSWQMNVEHAATFDQAKDMVEQSKGSNKPFDIILSEYNLNDRDALGLAKEINNLEDKSFDFVLMAAGRYLKNPSELAECGIEILLEKPITIALLHDVLNRAIDHHSHDTVSQNLIGKPMKNLAVLVAEDNQINQMVISKMLKQFDIEPTIAANGLIALEEWEKSEFDLVLMDCEMPEMDGYEAAKQIRTREKQSGRLAVPIIALSAHARSDHQQRAEQSGMNNYLTKPITLSSLSKIIDDIPQ